MPLLSYGVLAIGTSTFSDVSQRILGGHEASEPQPISLDGNVSARFAGEMIASSAQNQTGQNRFTVTASPGSEDFVAKVAETGAIGVTSGQKFLLARWKGVPVTAFAASFLDTDTAIFALESAGIRSPRDLIGKRLGHLAGAEDAVISDAMLAQLGLPRSKVINVIVRDGFGALEKGELDAFVGPIAVWPSQSQSVSSRLTVLRAQDYGIHVPSLVYFASSDLLRTRPTVVREILRSFILGWQAVYEFPDQAAQVVASFDPVRLSAADVRFALDQQRSLVRPVGMRIMEFDEGRWRTLRDILLFAKLGTETVSLSTAVTHEFLRDVYRKPLELDAAARDLLKSD